MAILNILGILFPSDTSITTEMLQEASQTGVNQLYRACGETGMFYKPGVLASSNDEDKLLPEVSIVGGAYRVSISAGKGVCTAGYIIENLSTVIESYGWGDINTIINTTPYLFAVYGTETTNTIQSISVLSGTTTDVSTEQIQDDFDTMFYWSASSTLPVSGDAILIGKLGAGYVFDYSYENRNIALLNVLFTDEVANPSSEIMPSVEALHSMYEFLACRGRDTRSIYNPFGLTDVDISDLGNLVSSLIEIPGIPARSFTSTNGDYLEITQNAVSGNCIDVAAGTFVDADGKFVDVDAITTIAIPSTTTWYYVYAQYVDATTTGSDHLLKSYEVTTSLGSDPAPVSPKYILGMVRCYLSGPNYIMEISDLRTLLSCRLASAEAPSVPYNLVLTTGSVKTDVTNWNYDLMATFNQQMYDNVYIRATWNHALTGDVAYFSVRAVPVDADTGDEIEEGAMVGMFNQIPPRLNSAPWSPSMSYTFYNVIPGIRYNVYVWAVGHAPAYEKSDTISDDIVAGFGEQLGPPSGLTLTEVYTTSYEATPSTDAAIHRDYKGIKATWGVPAGVPTNAVLNYEISIQFGSNVYGYNGTQKEFFYSATEEGTYYVTVRAFDNGGYGGEYASASINFGDETVPYWTAGDNLALSTGVDKTWIPVGEQGNYSRAYSEVSAHITAVWSPATDAKSGVSFYEMAFGPVADPSPSYPSEMVAADKIQFSTYAYLTADEYHPSSISKTFTGLRIGVRYGLKVRAIDACGNKGAWSGWEMIVAGGAPVTVPTIVTFEAQGINGGNFLTWTPSTSSVSRFEIFGKVNGTPSIPEDLIARVDGAIREYYHATPTLTSTANVSGNITSAYVSGATWAYKIRAVDEVTEYVGTISSVVEATPIVMDAVSVAAFAAEVVAARGITASLDARMTAAMTPAGVLNQTVAANQEVIDGRGGYGSIGERMNALGSAGVGWQDVRIVAKTGGHYATIAAAINSLSDGVPSVILIAPGTYIEGDVTVPAAKIFGLVGLGSGVRIMTSKFIQDGTDDVGLLVVRNLLFWFPSVVSDPVIQLTSKGSYAGVLIDNVDFYYTWVEITSNCNAAFQNVRFNSPGCSAIKYTDITNPCNLVIKNCHINAAIGVDLKTSVTGTKILASGNVFVGAKSISGVVGNTGYVTSYTTHNTWQTAPDNVTDEDGSVDTNTVLTVDADLMEVFEYRIP